MPKKIYVVQKHFASHLHWDFRLEIDGVLKSWAVPKEPMMDSKIKRLAILVEDHDLDYANFEGVIPEGQYGAGRVVRWDKGTYEMIDKSDFKYVFRLFGRKLTGVFVLVHMKDRQWLLYKKDE